MAALRDGWTAALEWLIDREAVALSPGEGLKVLASLLKLARADGTTLYALVDCARDDEALRLLAAEERPWRSLFEGTALEPSLASAPVLVEVRGASALARLLTGEAWGRQRAIYVTSHLDLAALGRHLAGFLRIRDPYGVTTLFRFYDPRVLRVWLRSCAPAEVERVLAGSSRVVCESEAGDVLVFDRPSHPAAPLRELTPPAEAPALFDASSATMEALDAYGTRLFQEETIRYLRRVVPAKTAEMTDAALAALAEEAIDRARRYRIVFADDVRRFAGLMAALGPRFDEEPRYSDLRAILDARDEPAERRLEKLDSSLALRSGARL